MFPEFEDELFKVNDKIFSDKNNPSDLTSIISRCFPK